MASASRHWPPPAATTTTTTSSSSTLSPLAPPFTVDRRTLHAYDYPPYFPPPAVVSSDLVRAEPFYPHYDRRGGAPWNGPFDEGVGDAPARDSFSSSPSAPSSSSSAWIGAGASAASPQGGLSENIWCSSQADLYGRQYFESDHQGWQQDKPSVETRGSVSNLVRSSAVFSPLELADASFNYFPSEVFSKGPCDTPSSASHCYFGSTIQNGSYRGDAVGFCSATTYCPQAHISQSFSDSNSLVEKFPKVERCCAGRVDLFEKYVQSRRHVSVSIREPDMKSNVEIVDNCVKSNGMSDNVKKIDAIPLHLEKENPASGQGLCTEEPQTKLHIKSDLTITSFPASSSVETGNCDQKTEVVDQLNLAEDSPCWKGAAIASRQSPFHIVNISTVDSPMVVKKFDGCNGKTVEGATPKDSVLDSLLDPLERKKEVSYSDDFTAGFHAKGYDDSLLNRRLTSSSTTHSLFQNEMAFEPVSKPLDSSFFSRPTWATSLSDASHIGRPIAPPKSLDLSATSTIFWDGHFLFRSLCDLSAFCLSYCSNGNVLNDNEYELLSMTRHNVEACLSKRSVAGEKKRCQSSPSQVEVPQIEGNNCLSKCNDRGMPEMLKMQPLRSDVDCDMYGGHLLPNGSLALTEDTVKNFVKSASKKFIGGEEDTESNLYKKLWIEAEAALCRMKYELHFARSKMEPQHDQQKTTEAMQDSSGAEGMPEQIRIAPFVASEPDINIENDLISVTKESQAGIGLNLDNDALSPKPNQASTSGVLNTTEDVDSSVMARFRVLIARANKVDSSNMGSPDKLHDCIMLNPDLSGKPSPSNPYFDGELGSGTFSQTKLDAGTCLQPSPPRPDTGGNPLASARWPEPWHVEAASGSYNSDLMGSSQRQTPLSEGVEGGRRLAGFHKNLGERVVIDSYIPRNGWHVNKFPGGKQGSNSSDWEHVREEDVVW